MTSKISLQTTIDIAAIVNKQQQEANADGSPANRHDLAEALKASYAAQGKLDVSPEMIERAIDTYFNDRLQFKGFEGGALSRLAGCAYLKTFAHRKLLCGALAASIIVGFSFSTIKDGVRNAGYNSLVAEFTTIGKDMAKVNDQAPKALAAHEQWLSSATASSTIISKPAYDSLLASYGSELKAARDAFMEINKQVGRELPHPTAAEVASNTDAFREQSRSLKEAWNFQQAAFNSRILALDAIEKKVADLKAAEKSYVDTVASSDVKRALSDLDVASRKESAEKYLATGDGQSARKELSALNQLVAAKVKHLEIVAKADSMIASYAGAFNYRESKDISEALFAQASYAAGKDDVSGLNEVAKLLKALKVQEAQVAMPLTIRVVNRDGVLSGVARRWDDTGKKRYYLIMEAVNKAGMAQERLVFNQETNKTEAVSFWGQEVDEATLRKVAADKKDDGIINDDVFGHKPAGVYSPIFERTVLKGTISRWPEKKA